MFYAISGLNGDYEAYERALKKLKFQNLDDIKEEDIMNEEAVISTLEGEDVLYVVGNIIGAGGGSIRIPQDMMSRDNVIAVVGEKTRENVSRAFRVGHLAKLGEILAVEVRNDLRHEETAVLGESLLDGGGCRYGSLHFFASCAYVIHVYDHSFRCAQGTKGNESRMP